MSVCPWCKGNMPSARDLCPLCGKSPHEHPSISAGNFGSFEAFDDFDEPGDGRLDIAGTTQPLAEDGGTDFFGGDIHDYEAAPLTLEVDVAPIRQPRRAISVRPAEPSAGLPAPTSYRGSSTPDPEGPTFDPYEIAALADYGPSPEKLWEFPAYAWRVTTRRRELRGHLLLARRGVDEAERRRDTQLAELAEQLKPQLESSNDLAPLLGTLKQIEVTASSRQEALSVRNQEMGQKVAVVDREIEVLNAKGAETKVQVEAAAKVLDQERSVLDRSRASCKRAEIELRNAQDLARTAAGPQARMAPPEHATKIQNLTEILAQRRAALGEPQAAYEQAKKVWTAADTANKAVARNIAALQQQRRGVEKAYAREIGMRANGVVEAESELRGAYVAIGARLIEMNATVVPIELRQKFFQVQDVLSTRVSEAERLNQAIVSADPQAVRKGWLVMVGGGFLALALLVLLIALFGRSQPEQYGKIVGPWHERIANAISSGTG